MHGMQATHAIYGPGSGGRWDLWAEARRLAMAAQGRHGPGGRRGGPHRRRHWGGPGGPGGFPGPGFPRRRRARGDVRSAALSLLSEAPLHGYQIMQEIAQRSDGAWQPSPGSVYPALQLLEDEGLIRAESADGKRVFHLTDEGRAYAEEHREELDAVWSTVTGGHETAVWELRDLVGQVAAATMQVTHAGSEAQVAEARTILADARRALYRILADGEPGTDAPEADGEA